jgi:hypothetical protein
MQANSQCHFSTHAISDVWYSDTSPLRIPCSHSGTRPPHCSFPPVALRATDHHQLRIEYSLIRLSSFWTLARDLPNQKDGVFEITPTHLADL